MIPGRLGKKRPFSCPSLRASRTVTACLRAGDRKRGENRDHGTKRDRCTEQGRGEERERTAVQGPFSENAPTTSEAANAIPDGRITLLSGSVDDVCVSLDEDEEISAGNGPEERESTSGGRGKLGNVGSSDTPVQRPWMGLNSVHVSRLYA